MDNLEYIGKCLLLEAGGKKILAVGDLHLGYEEALNIQGVGVGRTLFKEMMQDFEAIFAKTGKVDEVVLLGDVKHVFGTVLGQEREDFRKLLEFFVERCKDIIIIQGNHDAIGGFLIREQTQVREFYEVEGICFLHGDRDFPEIHEKKISTWIVGHAHPAITLEEGVKAEKYKCFLEGKFEGKKVVIVPSFSRHSEGSDVREGAHLVWEIPVKKFRVKIVGKGTEVLDFGRLGALFGKRNSLSLF